MALIQQRKCLLPTLGFEGERLPCKTGTTVSLTLLYSVLDMAFTIPHRIALSLKGLSDPSALSLHCLEDSKSVFLSSQCLLLLRLLSSTQQRIIDVDRTTEALYVILRGNRLVRVLTGVKTGHRNKAFFQLLM